MKRLLSAICLLFLVVGAFAQRTTVSVVGDEFYINGEITYSGRYFNGSRIEGLLMNSRMVNGIFDDLNPDTRHHFNYPDTGVWDADRNTDEFVEAMQEWREYGLLSFTLNLQGGSPVGYGNKGWVNSAFDPDGALRDDFKARLTKVLDRADELGMVVILGYFYFGADEYLQDEAAVVRATREATEFVLEGGYRNVIVEIANECDIYYNHDILQPERIPELIKLVKSIEKDGHSLLASTSFSGGVLPTSEVVECSDIVLLHGNGITDPDVMTQLLKRTRSLDTYSAKPIVVNEDDHYDYDAPKSNMMAAVEGYASWGFFDFRRDGEAFEEGYQSIPASWGITSERKRDFFNKVREVTGVGVEPETFNNPILSGYHPDPSICRVGEDYYLVNSSFEWFPAIPIYHSRDLVNWELIGYGGTDPERVNLKDNLRCNGGIYACTIRYHEGLFYIITTNIDGNGNFYITASDPAGEWSEPVELNCPGIDPSLFWDEDGKCYYVGHGNITGVESWNMQQGAWLQELDTKAGKLVGERVQLTHGHANNAQWAEGPHIYKYEGKYILTVAEGGTGHNHSITQFTADNIYGPYTANMINPVITHRHLGQNYPIVAVGHSDIVQTQNGEWWMVALGIRNFKDNKKYLARETFLVPMKWEYNGEEPGIVVNEGVGKIEECMVRPDLPWSPVEKLPARDEFEGESLRLDWNMLRSPQEKWYSLEGGLLTLKLREGRAQDLTNSSLLAQRIDAIHFSASTQMELKSKKSNEAAGLVLFRDDASFMTFMKEGEQMVVRRVFNGEESVVARCAAPKKGKVVLSMVSDGESVHFSFEDAQGNVTKMEGAVALEVISDMRVGSQFNGPMVGVYATSNGEKSKATAAFDWFEYNSNK